MQWLTSATAEQRGLGGKKENDGNPGARGHDTMEFFPFLHRYDRVDRVILDRVRGNKERISGDQGPLFQDE